MRHVAELKTEEQRKRWKTAFRRLIRASGKRQQDVAVEMARLIAVQHGRPIQDSAFVSALSRFCNAKDSAFPGWFHRIETRLEPLAAALGLPNDEAIWSALSEAVDEEISPTIEWHAAFPTVIVDVPVRFNGKSVPELLIALQHRLRLRRSSSPGICWIVGTDGSGKTKAAHQLTIALSANPALDDAYEVKTTTNMPSRLGPKDFALRLDIWGGKELTYLINALYEKDAISKGQRQLGLAWIDLLNADEAWLGFDTRPVAVIDTVSDILTNGLPADPASQRRRHLVRKWNKAVKRLPTLSGIDPKAWSRFWARLFCHSPLKTWHVMSKSQLYEALSVEIHVNGAAGFDRQEALSLLSGLKDARKIEREHAIDTLIGLVSTPPIQQLVEDLIQAGLLTHQGGAYSAPNLEMALHWAVDGMVEMGVIGVSGDWTRLSDPLFSRIVRELAIMGFDLSVFMAILKQAPQWCRLDVARVAIRFAAQTQQPASGEWLTSNWADALWGEAHSLFQAVGKENDFHADLHAISMRYVRVLPVLPMSEGLQFLRPLVSKETLKLSDGMCQPPVRDLQALSPAQFPPRNMAEWQNWKRLGALGFSGWKVLSLHAEQGSVSAARLLSEGDGGPAAQWSQTPVELRLKWLGRHGCRSATLRAFQLIATEMWLTKSDNDPSSRAWRTFIDAGKRLGMNRLGPYLERWASPLSLTGQMTSLMALSIRICQEFGDLERLSKCFERMWFWAQDKGRFHDGMIRFEGQSVLLRGSEPADLTHRAYGFCLDAAVRLYQMGQLNPLRQFWMTNEDNDWRNQAFAALAQVEDEFIVDVWIDHAPAPMPEMREALNQSERLLQQGWRRDLRAMRREQILQIAGLQNPIPKWAISYAQQQIEQDQQWPLWLSAHDEASAPLAKLMLHYADEPHRIWWAHVVHRSQPWPVELLDSLRYWLVDDPLPFERRSKAQRDRLGPNSTPGLALETLILLCRQRIKMGKAEPFFESGLLRLWSMLGFESSHLSWLIADALEEMCGAQSLLSDGWRNAKGRLRLRLIETFIQHSSEKDLRAIFDLEQDLGVFARAYGISTGISDALEAAKKRFIERGDPVAFEQLCSQNPALALPLLQALLRGNPNRRMFAMKLGDSALQRHDDGRLRGWLRQMAYEGVAESLP